MKKTLLKVHSSESINESIALYTRLVVFVVWLKGPAAVLTVEMSTGGEVEGDPLECHIIAPPGAAGAGEGVPVPGRDFLHLLHHLHRHHHTNNLHFALIRNYSFGFFKHLRNILPEFIQKTFLDILITTI